MHSELLQLLLRLSLKEHLKGKGGADEMCGPNTFTTLKRGKLESFHFNNSLSLLLSQATKIRTWLWRLFGITGDHWYVGNHRVTMQIWQTIETKG